MAEGSPYMFPKPTADERPWWERVDAEHAMETGGSDNFVTWHIRQFMDDPAKATSLFYQHVADRKAAAEEVMTQLASPIKTDGFWRQPQNNWATLHARQVKPQNPYDIAVANLEKHS